MKKILKLSIALIIICTIMMFESVYAVTGNISMSPTKTTIEQGKQLTITISLSNVKSDIGANTFGGTLKYDKEKLELVKFEGQNGWSTPKEDGNKSTYFVESGKFLMDAGSDAKSEGAILKITFKAKEKIEGDANITVENIMLADGMTAPVKVEQMKANITIKKSAIDITPDNSDDPNTPNNPDDNPSQENPEEKPDNKPNENEKPDQNSGNKKPDTTTKNEKLPQTGENNVTLAILLALLVVAVIILFVRMMNINRKTK